MIVEPVILTGNHVSLEPMQQDHLSALCEVGLDEELWRWTVNACRKPDDMERYMAAAFDDQKHGTALPFVTIDKTSGKVVGSTRFGNIDAKNRKAEIGWTWIGPKWQRTYINTEAKLLMLAHAFEVWKCIRVELKTDALNERSRNAILRIGAREEGIFRNHMITDAGRFRDTVYFSIIDIEWEQVRDKLIDRLRSS